MQELVIFGAGGMAREVRQIVEDLNALEPSWEFRGFLDGDPANQGKQMHGFPVLGDEGWIGSHREVAVIVAIGATAARHKVVQKLISAGVKRFATLIHPRAWIGQHVSIGAGTIVCAGVMMTTDIRIGRHVILNLGCTVSHDAVVEDYVTVAPGANISGAVSVSEGCDLGTNSTVIQGVSIGSWSVVGAGAVVVKPLPANVTAVGVPAKPIKERPNGWHLE